MVLTWEAKVVAAADAAADAAVAHTAETNWKHKVTPDRGDLIMRQSTDPCAMMVVYIEEESYIMGLGKVIK